MQTRAALARGGRLTWFSLFATFECRNASFKPVDALVHHRHGGKQCGHVTLERSQTMFHVIHASFEECQPMKDVLKFSRVSARAARASSRISVRI